MAQYLTRDLRIKQWGRSITAAPTSLGNQNSITTAFDGDNTKVPFPTGQSITGTATLGQPSSGYLYTPECYPFFTYLFNSSGWNNSTSTNDGRTAAVAFRTYVYQTGQGDGVAYNASVYVEGTRADQSGGGASTSFLANPAGVIINGDMNAGADGVYLNAGEFIMHDNGYDVAGIGWVINLDRTDATGAKNVWWQGVRVQSVGSEEIDVAFGARGPMNIGMDLTWADFPSSGTFISAGATFKAGQRIYLNATASDASGLERYPSATGVEYIYWDSGSSTINTVVNNSSILQVSASQVTGTQPIVSTDYLFAMSQTAIPAGGTVGKGVRLFSTANFGMFAGSGAPSLAAAKGSFYMRSDGSGTTDRAYINTDGNTTWTAITTVA